MKSKNLIFSMFILLLSVDAISQNLDNNKIDFTYTRMPLTPFSEDITQYWVEIDLGYIYSADSRTKVESQIKNAATIDGLEKTVDQGINLMVRLETYYRGDREIEETTKEEKRGDEKVNVTYYAYTFEYRYPLYFELSLPGEPDPMNSGFLAGSDANSQYTTRRFKSKSELSKYWAANSSKEQAKLRQGLLSKNTSALSALISSNYEFAQVEDFAIFRTVKKFKKHTYEDVTASFEAAQRAMTAISPEETVFNDEFRSSMQEAIDGWKKTLTEENISDKKSRVNKKVSQMLYRNLFKAHTLMGDFELAENVRVEAEGKIKNAIPGLQENKMNDRKARFIANGVE